MPLKFQANWMRFTHVMQIYVQRLVIAHKYYSYSLIKRWQKIAENEHFSSIPLEILTMSEAYVK